MMYEIRIVMQDGKFSFRKCILDKDGDVNDVSNEPYSLECSSLDDLKLYKKELDFALSLPVLLWYKKHQMRWTDVHVDDVFVEEDD